MFTIIFRGSVEIFYGFFRSLTGQHRQKTLGKKSQKKYENECDKAESAAEAFGVRRLVQKHT